mmetsp:Transcript_129540/g.229014  ORF Transcript_129540/g.229014 Transcript_129540/m.229014 type:complete len:239 (+) Transcript_129540:496-1212(+)
MQQCWFPVEWVILWHELVSNVTRNPEIWILVDRTRDETCHVFVALQRDFEGRGKGRSSLDGRKSGLANVGRAVEPKSRLCGVVGHGLPDSNDVGIHVPYVVQVREDEGLLFLETTCNDVLCILHRKAFEPHQIITSLNIILTFPEELLVVGHLDHQWHVERILQPLCHHEWDQMSKVHRSRRGTAPSVQVERLALFTALADGLQVSMRKEDVSAKPAMEAGHLALANSEPFQSLQKFR